MLKKSLSQHLLKDKNILNKMVRLAAIGDADTVVEIGAGHGDLTRVLIPKARYVYAVELDERFGQFLDPLEEQSGNLKIVFGDILDLPLASLTSDLVKVMGNIPYHITGEILFKLLEEKERVTSAFLTMQKEVALRLVSRHGKRTYGALSAIFQHFADVKLLFSLKPVLFIPPPKVESAFVSVVFKERSGPVDKGLVRFIKICFRYKRKYLKHTLEEEYGRERIEGLYGTMGFAPAVRAEELEPPMFERMYGHLS